MAISKTRSIQMLNVDWNEMYGDDPAVFVRYIDTWDDPDDDDMPVTKPYQVSFRRYQSDGETATDMSGEDQMIQDICAAVWTD